MTSVASAATITEVLAGTGPFDPTVYSVYDYYGQAGMLLSWDSIGSNYLFNPNGHVTGDYSAPDPARNPSWLSFKTAGASSGGGSGGSGGGDTGGPSTVFQHSYTLSNNNLQDWTMDFSVLIFDPSYTGSGMQVELLGSVDGSETYKAKTLTAAQIKAGMMLTWDIVAAADETVLVRTTSIGADEYAAGYFINSANPGTPEPATLALLLFGAGGLIARRNLRRRS